MSEAGESGESAPPQLSPDGYWWWTGAEWVPAADVPEAAANPQVQPEPEPALEPEPVAASWAPPAAQPEQVPAPDASWPAPAQTSWPAPAPAYGGYPAPAPAGTSRLALASLVCALAWLFGLGSIAAVVLGVMALRRIERSGGALGGKGLAIAGTVIGLVGVVVLGGAIAAMSTSSP